MMLNENDGLDIYRQIIEIFHLFLCKQDKIVIAHLSHSPLLSEASSIRSVVRYFYLQTILFAMKISECLFQKLPRIIRRVHKYHKYSHMHFVHYHLR